MCVCVCTSLLFQKAVKEVKECVDKGTEPEGMTAKPANPDQEEEKSASEKVCTTEEKSSSCLLACFQRKKKRSSE